MTRLRSIIFLVAAGVVGAQRAAPAQELPPQTELPSFTGLNETSKELRHLYQLACQSLVRVNVTQGPAAGILTPSLRAEFDDWRSKQPGDGSGRGGMRNADGSRPSRSTGRGDSQGGKNDGFVGRGGPGPGRGGPGGNGPGTGSQLVHSFLLQRANELEKADAFANDKEIAQLRGMALRIDLNSKGYQGDLSAILLDKEGHAILPTGLLRESHQDTPFQVTLPDGSETTASFIGVNPYGGYTIIQINKTTGLRPMPWAHQRVVPGDMLVSVSSAQAPPALVMAPGRPDFPIIDHFSLSSDDHGGAYLFDTNGELAAVAVAGANWSSDRQAFAAQRLRREVDYIIKTGTDISIKPLGIRFDALNAGRAAQLAKILGNRRGVRVTSVDAGSLAGKAGLKTDDVILAIDNRLISTFVSNDRQPLAELIQFQVDLFTRTGNIPLDIIRTGPDGDHEITLQMSLD